MKLLTSSQNIISLLEKINITTSEELLDYLPYRYEDISYSNEDELEDKQKIVILGKLVSNPRKISTAKLDIIRFFFTSKSKHFYNVVIYNRNYIMNQLNFDDEYTICGTYSKEKKEISVISIQKGMVNEKKTLRGIYHLPMGINHSIYRRIVERTFNEYYENIVDPLPKVFKDKYRLLNKNEALKKVHIPENDNDITKGLRTLKYHECLYYSLKNQIVRGENKRIVANKNTDIDTQKINEFILNLNFKLTKDQVLAIKEIVLDMKDKSCMYRLLQGDVGTGKTIVAALALYANFLRKKIGAFMVPTDSLARQQYEYLTKLFANYGIKVGLLIGSLSLKEKRAIKDKLNSGDIDVICGTHALFSEDVNYHSLGLAIIDEQHRFGVNQRLKLTQKDEATDLLMMSATPIPRSLALSIYGDLDISQLFQFPNDKRDVFTDVVSPKSPSIFTYINDTIDQGRQVFVVAPKIEGENNLDSVNTLYDIYKTLYKDNVNLLHGKMKSEEKDQIIKDFIDKKFLILITTSVIELGINVLSSGLIIIYSANKFGLASLHQLRGRVGRDGKPAICLLVDNDFESGRLNVLKNSLDGSYIAEMDMKLRGPGDILGTNQSGFPTFSCVNIVDDFKMFECARNDAKEIITNLDKEEYLRYYNRVKKAMNKEKDVTLFG